MFTICSMKWQMFINFPKKCYFALFSTYWMGEKLLFILKKNIKDNLVLSLVSHLVIQVTPTVVH